jgi:fructose-1,6-bisphosphatase/inositol monophosphatase family enzyme
VSSVKALLHTIADEIEKTVKGMIDNSDLGNDLGLGADGTSTKLIDDAAEKVCIRILEDENAELNLLSEECGFLNKNAKHTLVLDPIDGTHNAIRKIPFYSVSLAVGKNRLSNVEYGLVRNLVSGDTYWAEKGKGSILNESPIKTRPFESEDSMFALYVGKRATPSTYNVASIPRRGRALGCASLEMCLLAQGAFDVYYLNYEPSSYAMRVVDIAASTLILREAGGEVFNDTYDILDMNFELTARSNVIAVGDLKALEHLKNLESEKNFDKERLVE